MQKLPYSLYKSSAIYKGCLVLVCLITISMGILVQPVDGQHLFQCGINGYLGFPQGAFKENAGNISPGGGLDFIYSHPRLPFGIGISFGELVYGREKFPETIQSSYADFDVNQVTTNSIILGHMIFRFQNNQGRLRPYFDGLIGLNHLRTKTKIREQGSWDEEIRINNMADTAFSYGGGLGLMFCVYERPWITAGKQSIKKKWGVLVDLGVRYIKGGQAEYLQESSISREDGELYYDVKKSRTDLVSVLIGITLNF